VKWAKEHGINSNPEWYPGLTNSSSFEAFQALLNSRQEWLCPTPCSPCNVTVTRAQGGGMLYSMKIGECVSNGAGGSAIAVAEPSLYGHTCTKNYYVSFARFSNAFCSEVFAGPTQTWTVFTDGDVSQTCYDFLGNAIEGGCRGYAGR